MSKKDPYHDLPVQEADQEMNKKDCSGYETCQRYSEEDDLHCEDCDHYTPTDCFEDYNGKKPFWMKVKEKQK